MKPELHPDAAKNFNDKARALQDKVGPMTEALPSDLPTHITRPGAPAHVVSESEPFDFKLTGLQDQLGRTTARYFELQGRRFGLEVDRYKELARHSEGLQRTNALRNVVSTKWVEDRILDWMKEQYTGGGTPALADFIAKRCEEDVKEHEVWFPVARLSLESDLAFGNVVFKTIPKQMLDWLEEDIQGAKEGRSEEDAAQMDTHLRRIRHELQGLAASTITVEAEPQRAAEVGRRESERAVELLRVFDVAATTMPELCGKYRAQVRGAADCVDCPLQGLIAFLVARPTTPHHPVDYHVTWWCQPFRGRPQGFVLPPTIFHVVLLSARPRWSTYR